MKGIPVYSQCEHRSAPFFGFATVGYTPDGRIVGLSKNGSPSGLFCQALAGARTTQKALKNHVKQFSAGVFIGCRHICMEIRNIRTLEQVTVTSARLGKMRTNLARRTDFFFLEKHAS